MKAVELASKACSLTNWKDPDLWTRSALQFPEWSEKQGDGARKQLELYKEKKAYREQTP